MQKIIEKIDERIEEYKKKHSEYNNKYYDVEKDELSQIYAKDCLRYMYGLRVRIKELEKIKSLIIEEQENKHCNNCKNEDECSKRIVNKINYTFEVLTYCSEFKEKENEDDK